MMYYIKKKKFNFIIFDNLLSFVGSLENVGFDRLFFLFFLRDDTMSYGPTHDL